MDEGRQQLLAAISRAETAESTELTDNKTYRAFDIEAARARVQAIYDDLEGSLREPMHDNTVISAAKYRAEVCKWLLSKLLPQYFGDKVEITNNSKPLPQVTIIIQENRVVVPGPLPASSVSALTAPSHKNFCTQKIISYETNE